MPSGKSRKHRPEPQGAGSKTEETDQVQCKAIQVEPLWTPWAPTEPNARGDAPSQEQPHAKDWNRQRRHSTREATLRTGSTNETDAKKRLKVRSGQSQRASTRPTAEADKDSAKKERGMEWATPTGPQTEEQTRDRWRIPEGEEPRREGRTLTDSRPQWGPQPTRRQPQGAKRIHRQRPKPNHKEISPSTKDNLRTGGSAGQVV